MGYGLLPMLLLGLVGIFISLKSGIGILVALGTAVWASFAAGNFMDVLIKDSRNRKILVIYPLFLFYVSFTFIVIFWVIWINFGYDDIEMTKNNSMWTKFILVSEIRRILGVPSADIRLLCWHLLLNFHHLYSLMRNCGIFSLVFVFWKIWTFSFLFFGLKTNKHR